MGKIKLHGSKKKKSAQKGEGGQISADELRRTLGFPDGTEFLGYAFYLKEKMGTVYLIHSSKIIQQGIMGEVDGFIL